MVKHEFVPVPATRSWADDAEADEGWTTPRKVVRAATAPAAHPDYFADGLWHAAPPGAIGFPAANPYAALAQPNAADDTIAALQAACAYDPSVDGIEAPPLPQRPRTMRIMPPAPELPEETDPPDLEAGLQSRSDDAPPEAEAPAAEPAAPPKRSRKAPTKAKQPRAASSRASSSSSSAMAPSAEPPQDAQSLCQTLPVSSEPSLESQA